VCPDFVFEVYRFDPIADVTAGTAMDEVGA
jgi:hypothetical protein